MKFFVTETEKGVEKQMTEKDFFHLARVKCEEIGGDDFVKVGSIFGTFLMHLMEDGTITLKSQDKFVGKFRVEGEE